MYTKLYKPSNEKLKPNHITFDFSKHHRNPSGLHNKVDYLLGKSCWNLIKLDSEIKKIFISPCDLKSYISWTKSISITSAIISGRKELFKDTKEWGWIKNYDRRF